METRRLHHIGLDRRHAGIHVRMLAHELRVRVLTNNGELRLNPDRDYQPAENINYVPRHL